MVRASTIILLASVAVTPASAQSLGNRIACGTVFAKAAKCQLTYDQATKASRIDETTIRVSVSGNDFNTRDQVYRFAMRRAAEATLAAGYDVFDIVEQRDTSRHKTGVRGGGTNAIGQADPVSSYDIFEPGQAFTIKLAKGPKAPDGGPSLYDAREVIRFASDRGTD